MDRSEAIALLAASPLLHMATTDADGAPVFRTVNGVVVDDVVAFHGAPAGEKMEALGRPAVLSVEEPVALVPSYWLDPERACPATTLYRSVQVHGTLDRIDDPTMKARVLQALMEKLQPEGGHAPIAHDDPRYRKVIDGLLLVGVSLARVDGKSKLAQNRSRDEVTRLLDAMWARGGGGDPRAIELVRRANPDAPTPAFLDAPAGVTLCCAPDARDVPALLELLRGVYWNVGVTDDAIAATHRAASAWVGARDAEGQLVSTARALSDRAKRAFVFDVAVRPDLHGRGVGRAVMRLLLDHPAVRGCPVVWLRTRDAQRFYEPMGFRVGALPRAAAGASEMVLDRASFVRGG